MEEQGDPLTQGVKYRRSPCSDDPDEYKQSPDELRSGSMLGVLGSKITDFEV